MLSYAGEFETHLTLATGEAEFLGALRSWAEARHLKFTHILLARGMTQSQPMVTRHGKGTLVTELAAAQDLVKSLEAAGHRVIRTKMEVSPSNADVPGTDADVAALPAYQHFEHHVKILLKDEAEVAQLARAVLPVQGHVSRNARRNRPDGQQERFVTQRCYGMGRHTASGRLADLLRVLTMGGYKVMEVEEEYVVYDSDVTVDAGWMDGTGSVA